MVGGVWGGGGARVVGVMGAKVVIGSGSYCEGAERVT